MILKDKCQRCEKEREFELVENASYRIEKIRLIVHWMCKFCLVKNRSDLKERF